MFVQRDDPLEDSLPNIGVTRLYAESDREFSRLVRQLAIRGDLKPGDVIRVSGHIVVGEKYSDHRLILSSGETDLSLALRKAARSDPGNPV